MNLHEYSRRACGRILGWGLLWGLLLTTASSCVQGDAPPPQEEPRSGGDAPSEAPNPDAPVRLDEGAAPAAAAQSQNPIDIYVEKAASYLGSTQQEDGSWDYFQSRTPDFAEPERHANVFGTMMTLINLTNTKFEASSMFVRGADYVESQMLEGHVWSLYPEPFPGGFRFAPDADDTSVALMLLAGRLELEPGELQDLRARFESARAPSGLYRTYFDGYFDEKGFIPDPNIPSIGVNLNVLGFFGKYELERAGLVEALDTATEGEGYWASSTFYRSLPLLAYLASNAVEQGAPEAGELLRRFLEDFEASDGAGEGFAENLGTVELAAYVKAKSHACLLEQDACRGFDLTVFELSKRRNLDGSWIAAPFYEYDVNPDALVAFIEGRDYRAPREDGSFDYDAERALQDPGAVHYFDGSSAETTSFALKALVLYRELLDRRPAFQ